MIIGYDAKRAFHNNRGLGNYSRDLIRIMQKNFPENKYLLFNPAKSDKKFLPEDVSENQVLPGDLFYKSFPSLWRSFGICRDLKNLHVDLYHGLSQELPLGIDKLSIKTVVTFHDAIFLRYPDLYDRFYRETFIRKNKYSLAVADKVIAISEQSKSDAVTYFGVPEDKIEVVYQGCNQMFRQILSVEDKVKCQMKFSLPDNFILTVGAIEERKNLRLLILAYHQSAKLIPLVIAGKESQHANELKKLVSEKNLSGKVMFLHQVENADLPALYQSASLFIFPSIFEGFGIPILESICSGVPVITSTGSCFTETGGDACIYVNPLDADEMAEAIDRVLNDTPMRLGMIEEGYRHAANFTEDKIASSIISIYKSVL